MTKKKAGARRLALEYVYGLFHARMEVPGVPRWFALVFTCAECGVAEYSTLCVAGDSAEEAQGRLRELLGGARREVLVHYDGGAFFKVFRNGVELLE